MLVSPEQLLDLALRHGAEAAEVYVSSSSACPAYFEANRLKQLEFVDTQGIALRLWHRGKPGLVVAHGIADPISLVEKALAMSELNETEEPQLNPSLALDYASSFGEAAPTDRLIEAGNEAIQRLRAAYPEVLCAAQWESSTDVMRLINSKGLDCQFAETTIGAFLSAEWIRGEDFLNVYATRSGPSFSALQDLVEPIKQYLGWAQENAPAPQGKFPVLFTPKAAEMLWGVVSLAMSGRQVQQKATPWLGKKGELVISPLLTLSQQPQCDQFYLPFDDEGTPTQAFTWIDCGVLQDFYTDRKLAQELHLPCRGNGYRSGLGSYPAPGLFNGLIKPGNSPWIELIGQIEEGLLVDQVLGGGPGISGDFSVNVDLGYRIHHGTIVGRVKDTMIAGNAYQALQQVVGLGQESPWQGSLCLPAMTVDGLSISSKSSK